MDTVFHTIPDWTLTNEEGKSFTNKQLAGKIYVADFFFTRCTSICPKMSTQLTRVQDTFGQDKDVEFASFTVDPSHDTPKCYENMPNNMMLFQENGTF
jgi:protein SCO1/2